MLGLMGSNSQISRAGLHCISEDSFYMIPSLLGLHFSTIGMLKLSISALLAWAKIAVSALLATRLYTPTKFVSEWSLKSSP
jgi:hypothetical protein